MPTQQNYPASRIIKILSQDDITRLLTAWAGETIFSRGSVYFKRNLVKNVVCTGSARILATVEGTRNYVTALHVNEDGDLAGECSCPCDGVCKHMVALALKAREVFTNKDPMSPCGEFDPRLEKLAATCRDGEPIVPMARLRDSLAKLSKDALLELLLRACEEHRDILLLCATRGEPDGIGILALENDVRKRIAEAVYAPDFEDDDLLAPDYELIAEKIHTIVAAGKPALALDLATKVLSTCDDAIEMYDHECEIIGDVYKVAAVGLEALEELDWPTSKKIIWTINALLDDNFGYCDGYRGYLQNIDDSGAWSDVAAYLAKLDGAVADSWKHATLIAMRKLALEKCGNTAALLQLYESEAEESRDYLNIVDYLLDLGKDAEAEKWIMKGLKDSESTSYANALRTRLMCIREREGNYGAIVALQTEIFVNDPCVREYDACARAAKKTGHWEAVKPLLEQYLTTGKLPWLETSWPWVRKGFATPEARSFPLYRELTELALHENRPLDALKWYDEQRKSKRGGYSVSETCLAEAIKDVAPERAFAIWRAKVDSLIAETNNRCYHEAGEYLTKMLQQAAKMGDKNRWLPYLHVLREQHKRKRNFIKILDAIEQGKSDW